MPIELGQYLGLNAPQVVTLDGDQAEITLGDATVIRVTTIVGTPVLVGIRGGVDGRTILIDNATAAGTFSIEQFSIKTEPENRIACEDSTPFDIGPGGLLWLGYVLGKWRNVE